MSHIRVLVCRVDDPHSDHMTELTAFDLPPADVTTLQPETALDELETTTQETGNTILPRLLGVPDPRPRRALRHYHPEPGASPRTDHPSGRAARGHSVSHTRWPRNP